MLFKSNLLSQASGSTAGITAANNRGGQYLRQRSIPTNPTSAQQTAIRNTVSDLTSKWSNTLTPAQREAWKTYADNVAIANRLGDARNLPPISHYIRSNVPRLQVSEPRVDDGPTTFNLGDFGEPSYTIVTGSDDVDVAFDTADAWVSEDDAVLLIYASRPQSAATEFFNGPYRLAGTVLGSSGSPPTSPQTISLPFAVNEGQRVFFYARVSRADGRLASRIKARADAPAP